MNDSELSISELMEAMKRLADEIEVPEKLRRPISEYDEYGGEPMQHDEPEET